MGDVNDAFQTHSQQVPRPGVPQPARLPQKPDLGHAVFAPTLSFLVLASCFAFVYPLFFFLPWVVVLFNIASAFEWQRRSELVATTWPKYMRPVGESGNRPRSTLPLVMGLLAVLSGVLLGLAVHEHLTGMAFSIAINPWYHNARASNPSAAYGDAGVIQFSVSSKVDQTQSLGYKKDLRTHCVAPVAVDLEPAGAAVGYWAVGVDCCSARAAFWCGGAGDARYRYAVPEPPRGWLFSRARDYYEQAVGQAEAVYGLKAEPGYMLLRWLDAEPSQEMWRLIFIAMAVVGAATFCFLLAAVVLAVLAARGSGDKPAAGPPR